MYYVCIQAANSSGDIFPIVGTIAFVHDTTINALFETEAYGGLLPYVALI
jgi:hypothetical protein